VSPFRSQDGKTNRVLRRVMYVLILTLLAATVVYLIATTHPQ
jgi:hypothetical protein